MFTLTNQSFSGTPSSLAEAKVFQKGNMVLVLALSGPNAHQSIEQIEDKFNNTSIDSPTSFLSLIERFKELWLGCFAECVGMFCLNNSMYLICQNGEIWLQRGSKFGRVLRAAEELKVVEGHVQELDSYLCVTQSASVALHDHLNQMNQYQFHLPDIFQQLTEPIATSGLVDRCALSVVQPQQVHESVAVVTSAPSKRLQFDTTQLVERVKSVSRFAMTAAHTILKQSIWFVKNIRSLQYSREHKKKLILILAGFVVVAGMFMMFVGVRSFQIHTMTKFLQPFEVRLEELTSKSQTNTLEARDQLLAMQKEYESQKVSVSKSTFGKNLLRDFDERLASVIQEVSGKVNVETLPTYFDFKLVRSDFLASKADSEKNIAVFLDQERQIAISLSLDQKQQTLLPIGQYPKLTDISYADENLYILADGIYKFPLSSQKEAEKIIQEGDSNRDGTLLSVFGDFLYVFNPEKRNIFRYTLTSSQESLQPIGWIQDKKDLDFQSVTSMVVDGTLWLATTDGKIFKYEKGNPVGFTVQGLQVPFSGRLKLYTKEDLDSLFVLEPDQNRAVRLLKDGTFVKEVQSPLLGAATNIIYTPENDRAYAVSGSLMYELEL